MSTWRDHSGEIASNGVAQVLIPRNDTRHGFLIQNLSLLDLWFDIGATAVQGYPSFKLIKSAIFEQPISVRTSDYISIIGSVAGQQFTAKEW